MVTPAFSSSWWRMAVHSGTQLPQPVPALVAALTWPTVVSPPSAMAAQIAPLDTLLQLQIVDSAPMAATPSSGFPLLRSGRIRSLGCSGRSVLLAIHWWSVP